MRKSPPCLPHLVIREGGGCVLSRLLRRAVLRKAPISLRLAHRCRYERVKQLGCQPVLDGYQLHMVNGTVVCE